MLLSELLIGLYDQLGHPLTPDVSIRRRLVSAVNKTHREILSMKGMGKLRRTVLPFTCVAGSPFCVLPSAAAQVLAIVDRANNRVLDEITLLDLRARDPGMNFSSSIPDAYVLLNLKANVATDPSAASALYAVSTAAGDAAGISVSVEGTITGGIYRHATTSMNGVTPVNLDASISTWAHVTKFYVTGQATGTITLTQGLAGPTLAVIQPGQSRTHYTQLHLSGTPGSALTYYADIELHIEDMNNPWDESYLPEDYDWLLECGALRREFQKREKVAAFKQEDIRWARGIADLRNWVTRTSGLSHGPRRKRQWSQLGSWFPAGS